jgi:hypothetical protein
VVVVAADAGNVDVAVVAVVVTAEPVVEDVEAAQRLASTVE